MPWISDSFGDVLRAHNAAVIDVRFVGSTLPEDQWRLVEEAEVVILATRNARESRYQAELGLEVARRRAGAALAAVATCNPYDFLDCPEMRTYVAIYEPTVEAFRAAADVLYGKSSAKGKLPVASTPPGQ